MAHPFNPRPVIQERELAERWRKSLRSLQRLRREERSPPWFRVGGSVYYRLEDIHAFEEAQLQGTGAAR